MVLAFHLCIKLCFRTVSYVQLMVRHYSFRVCNSTHGLLLLFNLSTDISVQVYIIILISAKEKKRSYCANFKQWIHYFILEKVFLRIKVLIIETARGFWDLLFPISSRSKVVRGRKEFQKRRLLKAGREKKANDQPYKSIKAINKLRWLLASKVAERELPLEFSFTDDPELYCLKSY